MSLIIRNYPWIRACLLALASLFVIQSLSAQQDVRTLLADLRQDMRLFERTVNALRLEVDQLRTENQSLRNRLAGAESLKAQVTVVNENLLTEVSKLERSIAAGDAETRKLILTEVKKQIKALGDQTSRTLDSISNALNSQPSVATPQGQIGFDNNYPEELGVVHEVQPGDTLSGIASKHKSRVIWIQKANTIADPTKIQVGQTLFIPQAE